MRSFIIAPFPFHGRSGCNPSPGSPREDKWTVSQTKATWILNTYSHKRQVTDVRDTLITRSPLAETQKSTLACLTLKDWKSASRSGVSLVTLKSCLCFYWKLAVAAGCYFKTADKKKEGLVFGRNPRSCQHKWNLLSLSCSEKHQRTSKMRDCWWGGKSPGWGHAGGGKSANCTPEGWAGLGRGHADETEAGDLLTPN